MIIADDRKKKLMTFLFVGVGLLLVLLVLLFLSNGKGGRQPEKLANVNMEIPEGDNTELSDSKIEAYGKDRRNGSSSISQYWDNIGEEPREAAGDDPVKQLEGSGGTPGKSADVKEAKFEDFFPSSGDVKGKSTDEVLSERDRRNEERRRRAMEDFAKATYANQNGGNEPEPEAPAVPETPEEAVVDRIQREENAVRRSDAISSIDDGFGTSGVSSLGEESSVATDTDNYPFKCMFVRDEKISNGDRVTVRLLEDMVIGGQVIPKNTHLMAYCNLGKRLEMSIPSIQIKGKIIQLNFDVYDANDGTKGIYCPEIDESTKQAVTSYTSAAATARARSLVGSIAQDAIQAGTILMSGTGKERKVSVSAGYQFYIVRSRS